MQYKDIPTKADIERIAAVRHPGCVSIYVHSGHAPIEGEAARIEVKNHLAHAIRSLESANVSRAQIGHVAREGDVILEDRDFWTHESHSLAVFIDGDTSETYRLPHRLPTTCAVSDRLYFTPLLPFVSVQNEAFILALSQNAVRLLEVSDQRAEHVDLPGLPRNLADVVGPTAAPDRGSEGRLQGAEGQKVRMLEFATALEHRLRAHLLTANKPLVLAAAEPLAGMFRGLSAYPHLIDEGIPGTPDDRSDEFLVAAARGILDRRYAGQLAAVNDDFGARIAAGTGLTELSDIARAATYGAVDTLIVDVNSRVPGTLDEQTGEIAYDAEGSSNDGVIDEIVRRSLAFKARVFAVAADAVPRGGAAAATLRFPV